MNHVEEFNNEVQNDVVVDLRQRLKIVPGGKLPTDTWLSMMKVGTIFLARPKKYPKTDLADFTKSYQSGAAVLLRIEDTNDKVQYTWHDIDRFVAAYDLFGILKEPDDEDQEDGENNDG